MNQPTDEQPNENKMSQNDGQNVDSGRQSEYREVVRQIRDCLGGLPSRSDQEWAACSFSSARLAVQQREEEQRRREARGSKRKRDWKQAERVRGLVQGEDPNKSAFWMLMEEYYRDVTKEDLEFLISSYDDILEDPAFKMPALGYDSADESRSSKLGSARKRVDRLHQDTVYYDTKGLQKRVRGKSSSNEAVTNTIEQFENPLSALDQEQLTNYLRLGHQLGTLKTDLIPNFKASKLPPKQWLQEYGLKQILDQSIKYLENQNEVDNNNRISPTQIGGTKQQQLERDKSQTNLFQQGTLQQQKIVLADQDVQQQQEINPQNSQQQQECPAPTPTPNPQQQVTNNGIIQQQLQQQQNVSNITEQGQLKLEEAQQQLQHQNQQQQDSMQGQQLKIQNNNCNQNQQGLENVLQLQQVVPQSDTTVSDQKHSRGLKRMFDGTIKDYVREITEQISKKKPPKWIQQTPFEFNGEDSANGGSELELNGQKIQPSQKYEEEALQVLRGKFGNLGQKYLSSCSQFGEFSIQNFDCNEIHPMLQRLILNREKCLGNMKDQFQIENVGFDFDANKNQQKEAVINFNNISNFDKIEDSVSLKSKQPGKLIKLEIEPQNNQDQNQGNDLNEVQHVKLLIAQNGIQTEAEMQSEQQQQQFGDKEQQGQQQQQLQQQIGREEDWQQLRSSIPELIKAADDEISNELLILQFQLYQVMKSNQEKSVQLLQRVKEVLPEQRKLRELREAEQKDIMAYVDKTKEIRRQQKRQRRAQAQNEALVQLSEGGTGLIRTRSAAGIIKSQRHPYSVDEEEEEEGGEQEFDKEGENEQEDEEEESIHSDELSEELLQPDQLVDLLAMSVPGQDVDDRKCCVCGDGGSKPPNQIVFCDRCDMGVHQQCYGLRELPGEQEDWLCCPCYDMEQQLKEQGQSTEEIKSTRLQAGQKGSMNVSCCLCPVKGGAFKKTFNGRCWAHLVCGFYCKGVHLKLERGTNCVDTSRIHRYGTQHSCRYCGKSTGGIPRCGFTNCQVHCHPICARVAGGALVKKNHPSKGWQYRVYCKAHVQQGYHWADAKERTPQNKYNWKQSGSDRGILPLTPIVVRDQVNVTTQLERLELCKIDLEEAQKVIEVVVKREELKGKILTGFTHLVQGACADVQAFQHEVAALQQQVEEEEKQKGQFPWQRGGHNTTTSHPSVPPSSENKSKQQRASSNRSRRKRQPNPSKQQSQSKLETAASLEKLHRAQELIVEARPNGKQTAKLELDESQLNEEPLNLGVNEALTATRSVMGKQFVYVSMDQVGQQVEQLP